MKSLIPINKFGLYTYFLLTFFLNKVNYAWSDEVDTSKSHATGWDTIKSIWWAEAHEEASNESEEIIIDISETATDSEENEEETNILDIESDDGGLDLEAIEGLAAEESGDSYGFKTGFSTIVTGSWLSRSDSDVSHYEYAQFNGFLQYQPNDTWEWYFGIRADYDKQVGQPDFEDLTFDYDELFLRYRTDQFSFTLGSQKVLWGVADEVAPLDQVSVQDITRGLLPEWEDRHRAYPMLRFEYFLDNRKLDVIWLPEFRPAELPSNNSIWSPIDRERGRIFGLPESPLQAQLIQRGTVGHEDGGSGGGGVRYSVTEEGFDYALTLARVRHSLPYYKLSNETIDLIRVNPLLALSGSDDNLIEVHPYNWIVGGDVTFLAWDVTWRFEGAYSSDTSATQSTLDYTTYDGFDWVFSGEFYPGDGDDRLNIQLVGSHIFTDDKIVDNKRTYYLGGQFEGLYDNERWRLRVRFNHGLNSHDDFVATEVAFLGWEPHELFLTSYFFDGSPSSIGGYYKNNTMFTIGWRGEF